MEGHVSIAMAMVMAGFVGFCWGFIDGDNVGYCFGKMGYNKKEDNFLVNDKMQLKIKNHNFGI